VPARHQTLRNTIQWSYDLLSPQEQRLFRQLSVFVGGCSLQAGEIVCAAPDDSDGMGQILDEMASLIDKSLVQQIEQEGDEPRLLMLETIREYALECLTTSGEMQATRQAHAAYYLALAEEAEPALFGAQQAMWLERLEREHDNLRAVLWWLLEQAEGMEDEQSARNAREMALRLGAAVRRFWMIHGHYSEGRNFLERALAEGVSLASTRVKASVRAKALNAVAQLTLNQSDHDQAETFAEESLALSREQGDSASIALSLYLLGQVAWLRGNFTAAGSLLKEALSLFRIVGDKDRVAYSLYNLAELAGIQGAYDRAPALFEESLALFKQQGNKRGIALSLLQLADALFNLQGDQTKIRSLLEEGLPLFKEVGDKDGIAFCFFFSGRLALSQGDVFMARSQLEKSLTLYREMGDRRCISQSLCALAKVVAIQDDHTTARALYEESLAISRVGHKLNIASGLEGLAGVVALQGEPTWAARLWGAAEALRDAMEAPIAPVERPAYEQEVSTTRLKLGEKVFAATWAEGRTMSPEQALAAQRHSPALPSTSPATYPGGLTAREVDVLRLLARGLTDKQIAQQLVISRRTVNAHLTSIYGKLQLSSRSAATRYAFEHHLV
jgi:DNA-binding CsgD family transcriptional regulator/tetratricopeptide (TPR) repeat protein